MSLSLLKGLPGEMGCAQMPVTTEHPHREQKSQARRRVVNSIARVWTLPEASRPKLAMLLSELDSPKKPQTWPKPVSDFFILLNILLNNLLRPEIIPLDCQGGALHGKGIVTWCGHVRPWTRKSFPESSFLSSYCLIKRLDSISRKGDSSPLYLDSSLCSVLWNIEYVISHSLLFQMRIFIDISYFFPMIVYLENQRWIKYLLAIGHWTIEGFS